MSEQFSRSVGDLPHASAHHEWCGQLDFERVAPQPVPHGRCFKLLFVSPNVTDITADGRGDLFEISSAIRGHRNAAFWDAGRAAESAEVRGAALYQRPTARKPSSALSRRKQGFESPRERQLDKYDQGERPRGWRLPCSAAETGRRARVLLTPSHVRTTFPQRSFSVTTNFCSSSRERLTTITALESRPRP
jgi:hypothetical protein